jgi:hypothetical protein
VAYVIVLLAVLALGIAAAFVARAVNTTAAPHGQSQGAQVCSSSMCDYKQYDHSTATGAQSEPWPSEGLVP